MKIIFIGTTEFGIPTLESLKSKYELSLIITQPDKPTGRKKILTPPPIKVWAESNNVPVAQPDKIGTIKKQIAELNPDLILVVAYGQIIPQEILDLPKFKSINIHGSLLPKYRGASPIQAALLNDEKETGITLIQMDSELDHGPIISSEPVHIEPNDNYLSLHKKLAEAAAKLTVHVLIHWFNGNLKAKEQDHSKAGFTTLVTLKNTKLDWSENAQVILNKIRAYNPEPGTWTTLNGNNVKILAGTLLPETKVELPGKLYLKDGNLAVKCRDQSLTLTQVLPAGKKIMSGKDFINGIKNLENKIFI